MGVPNSEVGYTSCHAQEGRPRSPQGHVGALKKTVQYMYFIPFWVIPRRLSSNCRRFGTHYRFHLHRQVNEVLHSPAYEDGTDSEFRNVGN